ncbi:hypothetical protein HN51_013460 [Arachis hypogaea]|uniref:Uncharacterized protein n=1 Tax=Arachis hypogaea TaxID=3818 RepID=A0A445DQ96_ARAHY|nr:protein REVEILLE 2 [Arachis hypogaea]QHO59181.1 Protein REVEILLE [Arachis hypogaea]RYR65311.1 hypothetical protein Ahy_A03g011252 [Arachis hypogaea]
MAIHDQNRVTTSQGSPPVGNEVSSGSELHSVTDIQLKDQFSTTNDGALKVRKPYTIKKQRERWTDEEHKKFLEALKLHGRAWRRIEEHVGTKTAVQIRSHAQKFFSKVLRDSSGKIINSAESIEIPPPRPKRKPMHPYPRKLVGTPNKITSVKEQPNRSNSLKSQADFDQENQSPKSVLTGVGSDSHGSSDSDTPNGSLSPMSSVSGVNSSGFTLVEPKTPSEEAGLNADSAHNENPLVISKKEIKASMVEESFGQTVKLFGMTLSVTNTCRPSPSSIEACKPIPVHINVHCFGKGEGKSELPSHIVPSETRATSKLRPRMRTETCGRGFVPYKRFMAEREKNHSSTDREEQGIRLSL